MKIVVIGGTGLIGSKLVARLSGHGHAAVPAALTTGVNILTGRGLKRVLTGADVLVDVSDSPSSEDRHVLSFFRISTGNLVVAAQDTGVGHYVALSVVGVDRSPDIGYFRAKVAQEKLIRESGLPFSIVRATQFFESADGVANTTTTGGVVRLPDAGVQPMAADDVASALGRTAASEPVNGVTEIGGPEVFGLDEWVRTVLSARSDPRAVVADPYAPYFGAVPGKESLLPGPDARLATITLADWLARDANHSVWPG